MEKVAAPTDESIIVVNLADDDITRGDAAGWQGLAHVIGKKTDRRVVVVHEKQIKADTGSKSDDDKYEDLLAQYLANEKPVSLIFGNDFKKALRKMGQDPNEIYSVTSYNEGLSSNLISDSELVSHHLTKEMLDAEGAKFDERFPNIKNPIAAVMLVNPGHDREIEFFANKLITLMAHHNEATIYLCGSRRTDSDRYDELLNRFRQIVAKRKLGKKIDIRSYKFSYSAKYNPNKGLIARAKYFVVWGDSQSLVSEALFSGRRVYVYDYNSDTEGLKRKGLVAEFEKVSAKKPLSDKQFKPVNLTEKVADAILAEVRKHERSASRRFKEVADTKRKDWLTHLQAIRRDYKNAEHLPEELKTNREFVSKAVRVRGFSLQYFPAFSDDADIAFKALEQNKHAVAYIGEKSRNSKPFIQKLAAKDNELALRVLGESLRTDNELVASLCDSNIDLDELLPPELMADDDFVRDLIKRGHIAYENVPVKFLEGPAYEILRINMDYFGDMHHEVRNNREIMLLAIQHDPRNTGYLGPDLEQDIDLWKTAIKGDANRLSFAPYEVRHNEQLIIDIIKEDPSVFESIPNNSAKFNNTVLETLLDMDMKWVSAIPNFIFYEYPKKSAHLAKKYGYAFLKKLSGNYGLWDSTLIVLAAIEHNPEMARDCIKCFGFDHAEWYSNTDFMCDVAAIKGMQPEYLAVRALSPTAAKAIIKQKPEWAEYPPLKTAAAAKSTNVPYSMRYG